MTYLFLACSILSIAGLAAGMIRPRLVIRWGKRKTRGKVFLVYGLLSVFFLSLLAAACPSVVNRGSEIFPRETNEGREKDRKREFSRIEITSVADVNGSVTVSGTTDLPDGSVLSVDFTIAGPPDTEFDMAVGEEATVDGGRYSVVITPPDTPAFARGPFVVTVLFSPRAQTEDVLLKVGKNGENLAGESVLETFGFRVIQVSKQAALER